MSDDPIERALSRLDTWRGDGDGITKMMAEHEVDQEDFLGSLIETALTEAGEGNSAKVLLAALMTAWACGVEMERARAFAGGLG
jgi:hypothetical protein